MTAGPADSSVLRVLVTVRDPRLLHSYTAENPEHCRVGPIQCDTLAGRKAGQRIADNKAYTSMAVLDFNGKRRLPGINSLA